MSNSEHCPAFSHRKKKIQLIIIVIFKKKGKLSIYYPNSSWFYWLLTLSKWLSGVDKGNDSSKVSLAHVFYCFIAAQELVHTIMKFTGIALKLYELPKLGSAFVPVVAAPAVKHTEKTVPCKSFGWYISGDCPQKSNQ